MRKIKPKNIKSIRSINTRKEIHR
ncbi:hypothetical protein NQ317_012796 [Molorchus minor]|uniref:Uncharacterized protein n=1 Tax=Molorchus minor TaxID=1323400 RepID=A0ABQ9K6K5_9CUCU|nr:hypothetical protein NQ317_012796 [Molorchus minor]